MKAAPVSPAYMKRKLMENRGKLTKAAYGKAITATESIESLFSVSDKMIKVIAYVFEELEEVAPLVLQKLLYFMQGVYSALYRKTIFEEDCRAWVHGPVYAEVYELLKDFKYNPVEDARFALFEGASDALIEEEKHVIHLVANSFGLYGGKVLERITHNEHPWREARSGSGDTISSNIIIQKPSTMNYYTTISERYDIATESGLNDYINGILSQAS